jgi:isoleucyl-tRNA synthetase
VGGQGGDRSILRLAKDLLNATAAAAAVGRTNEWWGSAWARSSNRAVCRHPFLDKESLVMVGAHVTADAGTGCVHTALPAMAGGL